MTGRYFILPQSEIYVEVNPSFKLSVTQSGSVSKYFALNDDANNLFDNAKIEGKTLEDAAEYIFETLYDKGFLNEDDEIFISATGKNVENANKSAQKVKEKAEKCLKDKNINGKVNVDNNHSQGNSGENVSPSKATKIREILNLSNEFSQSELEDMSMNELNKILKALSKPEKNK